MPKEWPLEGHFECGGQGGLLVTPDCLGREFTSRRGYLRRWLAPAIREWVDSPEAETVG